MRINVSLIVAILVAVGGVAFIFTAFQISAERDKLNKELEARSIRASDNFFNDFVIKGDSLLYHEITDSAVESYGFLGVALFMKGDSIIKISSVTDDYVTHSRDYVS